QRLQRLTDMSVLFIPLLVAFQLFALDRLEAAAAVLARHALAELVLGRRGAHLVLAVVCALPRQPVGGPARVRRLNLLAGEREGRAGGRVDLGELRRKQL